MLILVTPCPPTAAVAQMRRRDMITLRVFSQVRRIHTGATDRLRRFREPAPQRGLRDEQAGLFPGAEGPPRPGSPQWTIDGNRVLPSARMRHLPWEDGASGRDGDAIAAGSGEPGVTSSMLSQYSRADEAPVRVSQYNVMLSST